MRYSEQMQNKLQFQTDVVCVLRECLTAGFAYEQRVCVVDALSALCLERLGARFLQVTDGKQELFVRNGVPMLTKITAAGCSVTALIAAFVATSPPEERVSATAHALAYFGYITRKCPRIAGYVFRSLFQQA